MAQGYHDFVAGEVLSAANLEDYCQNQTTMRFASAAARDAALASVLTEGLRAYLIDVNCETVYSGAAWSTVGPVHGALTSWTPTLTQSGAVTKTVTAATYTRTGRWIQGYASLAVTGTGTGANAVVISLPVATIAAPGTDAVLGTCLIFDTSATTFYQGALVWATTTTAQVIAHNTTGFLGATVFTAALAAGDLVNIQFAYEAAADA